MKMYNEHVKDFLRYCPFDILEDYALQKVGKLK